MNEALQFLACYFWQIMGTCVLGLALSGFGIYFLSDARGLNKQVDKWDRSE